MNNMDKTNINWYPGHMFKTKKELANYLNMVDVAVEVLDARIPESSRNIDLTEMLEKKKSIKRIIALNKVDLADEAEVDRWINYYTKKGYSCIKMNANKGIGISKLKEELRKLKHGVKTVKTIILGIPNVGKSTIINRLKGKNSLETKNKPGVTRNISWLRVDDDISMLDTPGMLWPRLGDEKIGINLSLAGAIKDTIFDSIEVCYRLIETLSKSDKYFSMLLDRYNISKEEYAQIAEDINPHYMLMLAIARKKGAVQKGGTEDEERVSKMIIKDFREGKIGGITLERYGQDR